jgi:hypothetical protein
VIAISMGVMSAQYWERRRWLNHAIHSAVASSTSSARDISTRDDMPTTEAETINHDLLDFLKT